MFKNSDATCTFLGSVTELKFLVHTHFKKCLNHTYIPCNMGNVYVMCLTISFNSEFDLHFQ